MALSFCLKVIHGQPHLPAPSASHSLGPITFSPGPPPGLSCQMPLHPPSWAPCLAIFSVSSVSMPTSTIPPHLRDLAPTLRWVLLPGGFPRSHLGQLSH